ncbi:hypothetical protein WJX73_004899 [Symbiochloris irregularis]|uniref:Uncharacterized protein n=1 Tax=Symbiochloris irregularis TaxID=706552 RepID=A0AAW1PEI5_9CHLO
MFIFASCMACVYVAGRLWQSNRELHYMRRELEELTIQNQKKGLPFPHLDASPSGEKAQSEKRLAQDPSILFYNVRGKSTSPVVPLRGPQLSDGLPIRHSDERLVGQIDAVEAGAVNGWACLRAEKAVTSLQVRLFVDGVSVGEVTATAKTPHHIIHRLCELDLQMGSEMEQPVQQQGVGFQLALPNLNPGRHEVRAFAVLENGKSMQELNQSPLPFIETDAEPGLQEALRRKDAIIRVRNAQISSLWDELHTRQPWRNALGDDGKPIVFAGPAENVTSKALVVLGVNTGLNARQRRDNLRRTWVPTGSALRKMEADTGVHIRFVIGYSEQKDDPAEASVQAEMREFGDIVRVDVVDTYGDLSLKTLKLFAVLPSKIDADFYFKVDDDVAVNVDALASYLRARRSQGNLYVGCMKSGQVLTDRRYKWFEPEYWRFGDPASSEGQINYPRHASGQIYGLAGPVAKYIRRNAPILHRFANEDVTLGAWLMGLDIQHVDERRLCCDSADRCAAQTTEANVCLSYYEHQCAGICSSESRLEPIYRSCIQDPLHTGANGAQLNSSHKGDKQKKGAVR